MKALSQCRGCEREVASEVQALGPVGQSFRGLPLPDHHPPHREPLKNSQLATVLLPSFSYKIKHLISNIEHWFCFCFSLAKLTKISKLLGFSQLSRENVGKNIPAHLTDTLGGINNIPKVTWLSQWKNNLSQC